MRDSRTTYESAVLATVLVTALGPHEDNTSHTRSSAGVSRPRRRSRVIMRAKRALSARYCTMASRRKKKAVTPATMPTISPGLVCELDARRTSVGDVGVDLAARAMRTEGAARRPPGRDGEGIVWCNWGSSCGTGVGACGGEPCSRELEVGGSGSQDTAGVWSVRLL